MKADMKIDETDSDIIALLRENGRMSNREVGRVLSVSEGTVRLRIRKLLDSKAMRLGLVTDFEAGGFSVSIVIRIKAVPTSIRAIADVIEQIESVSFVGLTLGNFDIMAIYLSRSRTEAAELINNHIALIEGVLAVDIREPVSITKHRYDLVHTTHHLTQEG